MKLPPNKLETLRRFLRFISTKTGLSTLLSCFALIVRLLGRGITQFVIAIIRLYQWTISPLLGQHCRFYPSCSSYAITSVQHFGTIRGSWLALKRLLRCHPWHPGGVDPVPLSPAKNTQPTSAENPFFKKWFNTVIRVLRKSCACQWEKPHGL